MTVQKASVLQEVSRLKDSSGTLNAAVNEINASAKKISETGSALTDISVEMNRSIQKIGDEIDQLKV